MIWLLCLIVACIALIPVGKVILKIVQGKLNLEFYKRQGIKTLFFAKMGYYQLFDKSSFEENQTKSNLEYAKKLTNEGDDKGIIVSNDFSSSASNILIYDSDLIKDFLMKEDHFNKSNVVKRSNYSRLGLLFENGEKFYKSKALFSKIFRYEGLEKFVPIICEIANKCFEDFNRKNKISKDEFTKISLDDLFPNIFKQITHLLNFGKAEFPADSNQEKIFMLNTKLMSLIVSARKNPLYFLAPYIAMKLNLIKEIVELDEGDKVQKSLMKDILEEWEKLPAHGECVLDRIVIHNKECREKGNLDNLMTVDEATGNYNLFQTAGSDTSQNTIKQSICYMADKPENQQILIEINKEIYGDGVNTTSKILESCELLERWTKETLRIHSPISLMISRVAQKDIMIGKNQIRQGDNVMIFPLALNFNDKLFENPEKFNIDRFSKENEKQLPRYQYIPFSTGKRVCLGRTLGEMMVKILVTQFCKTYTFEKPCDVEYYTATNSLTRVTNPCVNIKVK